MITPAYSLTATASVLPKLALDFTVPVLDSRITLTRSGATATCVNSSGNIETVAANTARFDYSPVTKLPKGLLIEESRINICKRSDDFNNASWIKNGVTLTNNAAVSPDGTQNAEQLAETSGATNRYTVQVLGTTAASQNYTASAYLKSNGTRYAYVAFLSDSDGRAWVAAVADLVAGTITQNSNGSLGTFVSSSISDAGNGWYRVSVTGTIGSFTDGDIAIELSDTGTPALGNYTFYSFTGNTNNSIYVWGAQVEAGDFPTSYIPTTSASVTRNADVAVMTGTNFSSWWTATTGSAVVQAQQKLTVGVRPWVQFDDTTANNFIVLRGNVSDPELYIKATTDQAQIDAGTIAANTVYSLGTAWNTNDSAAVLNAGSVGTDTLITVPTVIQARIGCDGTNYLNGWVRSIRYWPQRLLNAELQTFSK